MKRRMSEKANKILYIILSLLLAVVFWLFVDASQGNQITQDFANVAVEFIGEEDTLPSRGLMLAEGGDATVTVKLRGPRSVISNLRSKDLRVRVNLTDINAVGRYSKTYELATPDNVNDNDITIERKTPNTLTVRVTNLYSREIPVTLDVVGSVDEPYVYMPERRTIEPAAITLSGLQNDVDAVASARVRVDITDADGTIRQEYAYELLDAEGLAYEVYSDIKPNPTIENVKSGVAAYKASGADYMITIGGGSSMDTGKAIGIIINNPEFEDVRSLEGVAPTKNKTVFTIAVPTTAGTAAEVTINYVITDAEKNRKMVCVDPKDIPVIAFVDPDMMSTMPKGLTASTGMDALTHAIEGYTTAAAWELADCLNLEAIRLIAKSLRGAVGNDPEGREGMALGQFVTGMAFSNVGLGIVHSMAHKTGAAFSTGHIPHGCANAIYLPYVIKYNAKEPTAASRYAEIARRMGLEGTSEKALINSLCAKIDAFNVELNIPKTLKDFGINEDEFKEKVAKIAELHGAELNIESDGLHGTTVSLLFHRTASGQKTDDQREEEKEG